jgi:hypothetical protein
LPYSEIVLWIVVCFVCSALSGCFSIAISWVTIELTSRPLPIPGELIVAMRQPSRTRPAGRAAASYLGRRGADLSGVSSPLPRLRAVT